MATGAGRTFAAARAAETAAAISASRVALLPSSAIPPSAAADGEADDEPEGHEQRCLAELDAVDEVGPAARAACGRRSRAAAGSSGTRRWSARSRRSRSARTRRSARRCRFRRRLRRRLPRPSSRDLDCHGSFPERRRHEASCVELPQSSLAIRSGDRARPKVPRGQYVQRGLPGRVETQSRQAS